MTRFARAKGSKASNERREEEPTPWNVMRQQLADQLNGNTLAKENLLDLKSILNTKEDCSKNEVWCDFNDIKTNEATNKAKRDKLSKGKNTYTDDKMLKKQGFQENISDRQANTIFVSKKSEPKFQIENISKIKTKKSLKCNSDLSGKNSKSFNNKSLVVPELSSKGDEGTLAMNRKSLNNSKFESNTSNDIIFRENILGNQGLPDNIDKNKLNASNVSDKPKTKSRKIKIKQDFKLANSTCKAKNDSTHDSMESSTKDYPLNLKQTSRKPKKSVDSNKSNSFHANNNNKSSLTQLEGNFKLKETRSGMRYQQTQSLRNNSNFGIIIANGREIEVVKYDGFLIKKDDAIELRKLRRKLIAQNISKEKINTLMKLERRKAEKKLAREKKNVCFHCRKFGHNFSDCPDTKDTELSISGMCFKCGSLEHSHFQCKVLQNQNFRHAICFVCKDQGHIARQCPLNPLGQYPKGGSCHLCGEVSHLRKDCPQAAAEKTSTLLTVGNLNTGYSEDISEVVYKKETGNKKKKPVVF